MDHQFYIEVGSLDSLMKLLTESKKKGLMKDISVDKVERAFQNKEFPMRVPVSMDGILELAGNPMLKKMFGKRIENGVLAYLKKAYGAG